MYTDLIFIAKSYISYIFPIDNGVSCCDNGLFVIINKRIRTFYNDNSCWLRSLHCFQNCKSAFISNDLLFEQNMFE